MGDKNVLMRPEDMEAFDIQCDMTGWESEELDPRRMRTDQAVTTATVGRTEREVEDLGQERMCRVYRLREVAQSAMLFYFLNCLCFLFGNRFPFGSKSMGCNHE